MSRRPSRSTIYYTMKHISIHRVTANSSAFYQCSSCIIAPIQFIQIQSSQSRYIELNRNYSFVNKEKHKQQLRDIKPATDTGIKTQKSQLLLNRDRSVMNYGQRYAIDMGNSRLVNRILSIARSNKICKIRHEPSRLPIQKRNIVKNMQLQRQKMALEQRIRQAKPAIGSIDIWRKNYEKSTMGRRKSKQFQVDYDQLDSIRKNTVLHPIFQRQSSICRSNKGITGNISSLPRMQIRSRYKTEIQCIESSPSTMR